MGISNFFRNIRDLDNCEKPRKVIGIAGAIAAITGLAYAATKCIGNWIDSKIQNNADKKREDYRAEKEQETETHKANEERATKEAQAQAQADAYERMRKADAELYREKMEIDLEKRRRLKEMAEQQNASAADEPADDVPESISPLRTTQELFNRTNGELSAWIVDGYAKPGQITLLTAGNGVGKSVLLTEIAVATAMGKCPEFLPDSCCASLKQDVVYYRIEDFSDELEGKYGKGKVLDDANIMWVLPKDLRSSTLDGFLEHVKHLASQLKNDTVVCIDPATKLDGYKHEACIKGLEEAQRIAKQHNVTLTPIVAVHLDEIEDWKPLTSVNIKGGDKAIQQAGAVIALRKERTAGGEHRFIQCLKEPKGHSKPFPEGVLVCKSDKTQLDDENCYLHFEFVGIKPEKDALPMKPKSTKGMTNTGKSEGNIAEGKVETPKKKRLSKEDKETILNDSKNGVSPEDIANKIGCHVRSVQRVKKNNRA